MKTMLKLSQLLLVASLQTLSLQATDYSYGYDEAEVHGVGSGNLLYDNGLPEGRFFCRTVYIIVETKVE